MVLIIIIIYYRDNRDIGLWISMMKTDVIGYDFEGRNQVVNRARHIFKISDDVV